MDHRGYTGSVEFDAEEGIFHGRVLDLRDTITYEADCEERLEAAFRDAVDEYLDQCWACETEPEPPPRSADMQPRAA
jgi:predicted HicB family RNase H-like nuclease